MAFTTSAAGRGPRGSPLGARELLLVSALAASCWWLGRNRSSRRRTLRGGQSLTTTQRDYGAQSEYDTDTALNEYLHFHYGTRSSFLDKALLGRGHMLTSGFERIKELCLQHMGSSASALDVGCATGALTFALSEHFQKVSGIDTSMAFIQACCTLQRRRAVPYVLPGQEVRCAASISKRVRPERCTFVCIDAVDFMQTGAKFDLILACNVLCRLPRPRDWLALLSSSLTPKGVVVLVSPYAWLEAWTPQKEWLGSTSEESSKTLMEIMTRNGFSKLHQEEIPFLLAQNDRIHELFVSELTIWSASPSVSPSSSPKSR